MDGQTGHQWFPQRHALPTLILEVHRAIMVAAWKATEVEVEMETGAGVPEVFMGKRLARPLGTARGDSPEEGYLRSTSSSNSSNSNSKHISPRLLPRAAGMIVGTAQHPPLDDTLTLDLDRGPGRLPRRRARKCRLNMYQGRGRNRRRRRRVGHGSNLERRCDPRTGDFFSVFYIFSLSLRSRFFFLSWITDHPQRHTDIPTHTYYTYVHTFSLGGVFLCTFSFHALHIGLIYPSISITVS